MHCQISHVELDALHWGPQWTPRPAEIFSALVAEALAGESWVVDGNYHQVRSLVWARANVLFWLDYSLPLCLWRLTKRLWRRGVQHEQLWNGNRERLWTQLCTRDSLYLWAFRTYRRNRRQFTEMTREPAYAHLQVVRFKTPRAAEAWLTEVLSETSG